MNNSQQKEALKWRLRLIFLYYASYADRNNYKLLKSQNYRRFLIDSEAVTDQAGFPPFDIAFRKIHSSSIKLEQFQELLPVIARTYSIIFRAGLPEQKSKRSLYYVHQQAHRKIVRLNPSSF